MLTISVRSDVKQFTKTLTRFAEEQVPFATKLALDATAIRAQEAERDNILHTFASPTPFTVNSVAVKRATKASLTAMVFVKDIAAAYLLPYETGGLHKMIGQGVTWLNPKDRSLLNQYGNLSASTLSRLRSRPDIFVGTVKMKNGDSIGGVWQRPMKGAAPVRGKAIRAKRGTNTTGRLKLLIRFGDPMPVKQHLNFGATAKGIVAKAFPQEFDKALKRALATARR